MPIKRLIRKLRTAGVPSSLRFYREEINFRPGRRHRDRATFISEGAKTRGVEGKKRGNSHRG